MNFKTFGFLVTDACTAACDFCGLECSPNGESVIPLSLAKRAMDEAKTIGTFERCALSGGEVFLHVRLAAQILDYAMELGFERRTIASNGFWGAWPDAKIDRMLDSLSACTHISFSTDAFHAKWVKPETVWRAVEFTKKHRIDYSLHIADIPGELSAGNFLASQGDKAFFSSFYLYPLLPAGRALALPRDYFIREAHASTPFCPEGGVITVRYDGEVFPCCVPGIQDTCFTLGNLKDKTLSEILFQSTGARLLKLIQHPSCFAELAKYAAQRFGFALPEKVVNGCEVCRLIVQNAERMEELESYINTAREEILVNSFFKAVNLENTRRTGEE